MVLSGSFFRVNENFGLPWNAYISLCIPDKSGSLCSQHRYPSSKYCIPDDGIVTSKYKLLVLNFVAYVINHPYPKDPFRDAGQIAFLYVL